MVLLVMYDCIGKKLSFIALSHKRNYSHKETQSNPIKKESEGTKQFALEELEDIESLHF